MALTAPASADTTTASYKGITLGALIPDTMVPVRSRIVRDMLNADAFPAAMQGFCDHDMLPAGASGITVTTQACDGPVLRVAVDEALFAFFDPSTTRTTMATDLDTLTFKETTLTQARDLFGSEGLITPRWFGQTDPDTIGAFAFVYQLDDTDTYVALWFQMPAHPALGAKVSPDQTTDLRDDAVLIAIDWMSDTYFTARTQDATPRPSDGYRPLPDLFAMP